VQDNFPGGFKFPFATNDQQSPNIYPSGPYGPGNPFPYPTGGRTSDQFLQELLRSGVGQDEAKQTTDTVYGAGSPNQSGGNWLTGDPTRDPVRQFVMDAFAKHGKQPTGPGSGPTDLEYYVDRILQEGGLNSGYDWAGRISRGITGTQPPEGGGGQMPTGFGQTGAYNPFDDPATKPFIDLLNSRIAALQQPHDNPDLTALQGYLRDYFAKLQGPTYTDQQRDVMQTQSLDPLERQRGAAQTTDAGAARGARDCAVVRDCGTGAAGGGQAVQHAADADPIRLCEQGNRPQSDQPAASGGVGQLLANLDQTQFAGQEGRADQALGYAQTIPNLARQRLQDAVSVMQGQQLNPSALIGQSLQADALGQQQNQAWMSGIFGLLPYLLKMIK
jgi:hypothetical protein